MNKKLDLKDEPLPQDLTEGVDDDEWVSLVTTWYFENTGQTFGAYCLLRGELNCVQLDCTSVPYKSLYERVKGVIYRYNATFWHTDTIILHNNILMM